MFFTNSGNSLLHCGILILVVLNIILFSILFFKWVSENPHHVPKVEFPFKNFKDDSGRYLPIIAITAPLRSKEQYDKYLKYKQKRILIIGMSSYMNFPNPLTNTQDVDIDYKDIKDVCTRDFYLDELEAWLICFREPLSTNKPQCQISQSDFTEFEQGTNNVSKKYDYLYVCLSGEEEDCETGWQAQNRNWKLAKPCIEYMDSLGLKGLIVGRKGCEINDLKNTEFTGFLSYHTFQDKMKQCSFLFLPNILDASPRVITECLVKNIPVLMNEDILGGWKYIHDDTGMFFKNNVHDFKQKLPLFLNRLENNSFRPLEYYKKHYGIQNTGKRLKKFLEHNTWITFDKDIQYIYPVVN